jgi:pimeloyl-ACP methyl ester carboxylesterase
MKVQIMVEPLVLLPAMMCDARLFAHQINELSRDRSVQVAPMTNDDSIEQIAENVLAAAPAKFALAGLGMGATVAMEIQRRAPARVTRLALMGANAQSELPIIAAARETQIVKARSGRLKDVIHDEMRPEYLAPSPRRSDVLDVVMEMALDLGVDVFVRQTRAMQRRPDQQKTLRMIRVPTLVLCGIHDELMPVRRHEFLATLIPSARIEILSDAGHLPPLEEPEETNRHLRDWLAQPYVLR